MAFGDVICDEGALYVVVWNGQHGDFSLICPVPQEPSVFYVRSGHERKVTGSERKPHVRRVSRRQES